MSLFLPTLISPWFLLDFSPPWFPLIDLLKLDKCLFFFPPTCCSWQVSVPPLQSNFWLFASQRMMDEEWRRRKLEKETVTKMFAFIACVQNVYVFMCLCHQNVYVYYLCANLNVWKCEVASQQRSDESQLSESCSEWSFPKNPCRTFFLICRWILVNLEKVAV